MKKDAKFEIGFIRSLANGGTNKASNLQPLCKACQCMNEHEQGEYIKVIDIDMELYMNVIPIYCILIYGVVKDTTVKAVSLDASGILVNAIPSIEP
jgi:hypothetical protein